jgi:hypothetical protein
MGEHATEEQEWPKGPEGVLARLREDLGREGYQRNLDDDHICSGSDVI